MVRKRAWRCKSIPSMDDDSVRSVFREQKSFRRVEHGIAADHKVNCSDIGTPVRQNLFRCCKAFAGQALFTLRTSSSVLSTKMLCACCVIAIASCNPEESFGACLPTEG